jgi:hypothetical protein
MKDASVTLVAARMADDHSDKQEGRDSKNLT